MNYIYLMRAGDKHYKVGVTKDLAKRVKSIQTSNPNRVELVTAKLVELPPFAVEQEVHQRLVDLATGGGTEWFSLSPEQVIELCIFIQSYPHLELSERVIVKDLLDRHLVWRKTVEKKLDLVLNNYQKAVVRTINAPHPRALYSHEPAPAKPSLDPQDELDKDLRAALAVFVLEGKASTSLLQRRRSLGYGRAARIMDELEARGCVGPADGARPRDVLRASLPAANPAS